MKNSLFRNNFHNPPGIDDEQQGLLCQNQPLTDTTSNPNYCILPGADKELRYCSDKIVYPLIYSQQ